MVSAGDYFENIVENYFGPKNYLENFVENYPARSTTP